MRASPTAFVLVALVATASAISTGDLYSNGRGLDAQLPPGDETTSEEIYLKVPVTFYGDKYESIFVNTNGLLSFKTDIPDFLNMEFPLDYPVIAPLYTNVDTSKAGTVYYRETQDAYSLLKASEDIHKCYNNFQSFQPTSVFIATWSAVGYHSGASDRVNTYQVAVISNGSDTFVQFLYPDDGIQWIQATNKLAGLADARAQAGFVSEDGRYFLLKDSGKEKIRHITSFSNCEEAGKFMYHVGAISENVEEPNIYALSNVDSEHPKSCSQGGAQKCHSRARCEDFVDGFCCICSLGYYGNGRSCIKNDAPLRVNGDITGELNGELLEPINLQAYVVVSDGRTYTALSNIYDRFGYDMQTLSVLGGVIGWLFAKPSDNAKNGYQLTGGIFNHTTEILFQDTHEKVTIRQYFEGLDLFDQLKLRAEIKGSIPKIPQGSKLEINDYEEQYTVSRPGLVLSKSSRSYKNKGAPGEYPFTIEQTITYHACPYVPQENYEPMTLKVAKNFLGYESRERIIRYGMSNKIGPFGREDPCVKGRETCDEKSSCVVEGDFFRCICNSGYQEIYMEDRPICVDTNECSTGTHNCDINALCVNQEGSYTCHCNDGYEGNGASCRAISVCQANTCNPNAHCYESRGRPYCECNEGFQGDGHNCRPVSEAGCDVLHNCSPYATCYESDQYGPNVCQCLPGYVGDGYTCNVEEVDVSTYPPETDETTDYDSGIIPADCVFSSCVCPFNYQLNGVYCYIMEETTTQAPTEDYVYDSSCNVVNRCHPYAQCVYVSSTGKYECKCTGGFEGDGSECTEIEQSCEDRDICDPHATCMYDPASSKSICVCNSGYQGDGHVCSSIGCRSSQDCEENAVCKYSDELHLSRHVCVCKEGYTRDSNDACVSGDNCNGAKCADYATCHWDTSLETYYCQCDPGFIGDGIEQCTMLQVGCDTLNDCDSNASCELNKEENKYKCICLNGYYGNGHSCSSEQTCEHDPYYCSPQATCINKVAGFTCECNHGFVGNGTHCRKIPRRESNFLMLNQGMTTLRVPFEPSAQNPGRPIHINYYQMAIGLDIDCHTDRVYWSDITGKIIKSSKYDGSFPENFLAEDIISPEGLSIDWVSRNIYWTDSRKDTIEVASLDTKIRKVLFDTDIMDPRGIAVHPYKGKIFWSDWYRKSPKIEWANMDGTDREIFLGSDFVTLPNSLAIDWDTDELCYADAGTKSIECVNIDTQTRRTAVANCSYPFGLSITPTHYYWTDWTTQKIERLDKTTNIRQVPLNVPLGGSGNKLYGMAAVLDSCRTLFNLCENDNGQCPKTHLCLLNGKGGRSCVCGKPPAGQQQCN